MREQTFEDIDIEEIPDIKDIVIDKGKSKKARIRERLDAGTKSLFHQKWKCFGENELCGNRTDHRRCFENNFVGYIG